MFHWGWLTDLEIRFISIMDGNKEECRRHGLGGGAESSMLDPKAAKRTMCHIGHSLRTGDLKDHKNLSIL